MRAAIAWLSILPACTTASKSDVADRPDFYGVFDDVAVGPAGATPGTACDLGGGYKAFDALAAGEDVAIIAGPQGGYHIFTSVRVRGFDLDTVALNVTVRREDTGAYLGPGTPIKEVTSEMDGWYEYLGLLSFVDDPQQARDQDVILRAEVLDGAGAHCVEERHVVAR